MCKISGVIVCNDHTAKPGQAWLIRGFLIFFNFYFPPHRSFFSLSFMEVTPLGLPPKNPKNPKKTQPVRGRD